MLYFLAMNSTSTPSFGVAQMLAPRSPGDMADELLKTPSPPPASPFHSLQDLAISLVNFFYNSEKFRTLTSTTTDPDTGHVTEQQFDKPCAPPSFLTWCRKNNIKLRELRELVQDSLEVRDAVEECYLIMKEFVIENGLTGLYDTQFAKFYATSEFKMVSSLGQVNVVHETKQLEEEEINKRKNKKKKLTFALDQLEDTNSPLS